MPRSRNGGDEVGFGSDSFLDIIANIVGILIILIVVAGVRVSQAPLIDLAPSPDAPAEIADSPAPPLPSVPDADVPTLTRQLAFNALEPIPLPEPLPPEPVPEPEPEPIVVAPPAPPEPSPELQHRIADLRTEIASLAATFEQSRAKYGALATETADAQSKLDAAKRSLAEGQRQLAASAGDVDRLRNDLVRTADLVVDLRKRVDEEESRKPPVARLEHRMTAVSRRVQGRELHFRLADDRVAAIPLDALLADLKDDVQRRGDWLAKFREHRGTVGPIDGFELDYVVERSAPSVLDQARGGIGTFRIGISRWEVKPTPQLRSETFEEAMAPGSRFRRALSVAEDDTALTFWVYPNSFHVYRKLQKAAHDNDFTVAARPLPEGTPIAGSPNGSHSAGQ